MAELERSVLDYCEALASRAPTPGGGGASALVGALGAALGSMAAALTLGKPRYAAVETELAGLADEAAALRRVLLELSERDAEAFAPLARAYAIPKDAPGRAETLETCLHAACATPLEIMRQAGRALALVERIGAICAVLAASDAGTGAALCRAALYGAAFNVRANTRLMQDRAYAALCEQEADALLAELAPRADAVCAAVLARLA
ncbi:MAG: cyclodeaminase/cyclohydrolase family protein [Clostridiales bacterium]|nr:cyclodeaminase/cyclohydrolase family protein [Clostridiales bacterium]